MTELTKQERKSLRKLAAEAHSRELSEALGRLEREFEQWRGGHIDAFDLNRHIHAFHDGESRDLWKRYSHPQDALAAVSRAIATRVLDRNEVSPELLSKIESTVRYFEEGLGTGNR